MAESQSRRRIITRRATLALPLAATGCGLFDQWFGESKPPLPGHREPLASSEQGLRVEEDPAVKVTLPSPVLNAAWPQAGGNPEHVMGHLAAAPQLGQIWSADIGAGGGYRRKILAQPIVSSGIVYTMDSDAAVSAFDLATGRRRWRQKTRSDKDRSTNVGGGLALEGGTLYSVNGLAELVALDPASGQVRWRKDIGAPARSSPTIAESRILVTTIEDKLLALATDDGRLLWSHQASARPTSFLGQPAPAYAEGMVVAGFGSGELAALRGETGLVVWTDSLAGGRSLLTAADISAIRGRPAISNGQVYAIGLGGWMVGLDLRSGRRVWEKEVAGQDSPWIAGDWMFVLSTQQQIAAVSRSDGRAAWVTDLPRWKDEKKREGPIFWFGPLLVGERLVVAGTNREALAVSPYTGAILGRQKLDGAGSLGPVVANGTVLIITDEGTLLALR